MSGYDLKLRQMAERAVVDAELACLRKVADDVLREALIDNIHDQLVLLRQDELP